MKQKHTHRWSSLLEATKPGALHWAARQACMLFIRILNLSSPKPGRKTGGRIGPHAGLVGLGRAGLFPDRTVQQGNNPSSQLAKHQKNAAWTSPQKHRQPKSYVNWLRNTTTGWKLVHQQFITGVSTVYRREEKRSLFLVANKWNDALSCPLTLFM